jgi:hypothetical protein
MKGLDAFCVCEPIDPSGPFWYDNQDKLDSDLMCPGSSFGGRDTSSLHSP